jgi:hypothetical protein
MRKRKYTNVDCTLIVLFDILLSYRPSVYANGNRVESLPIDIIDHAFPIRGRFNLDDYLCRYQIGSRPLDTPSLFETKRLPS